MASTRAVQSPPLSIRIPDALREALQKSADQNDRSLNAEIRRRLARSIDADAAKTQKD